MKVITASSQGQITIPKEFRDKLTSNKFVFEMKGKTILLRPVQVKFIEDDLKDFGLASEKSFDFWDNEDDDVYEKHYLKKKIK